MTEDPTIALVLRVRDGDSLASFRLDADPRRTALDLLEGLRAGGAPAPAYRHSCHHGSCGTCGAVINGVEALLCLTTAAELARPRPRLPGGPALEPERDEDGAIVVTLEPLAKMTVISGIAVEPGTAFAGIPAGASYLTAVEDGARSPLPPEPEGARVPSDAWRPPSRARFESCIECGLCVSACPVTARFIGPAALAAVNRELEKRPERKEPMLRIAAGPGGARACDRRLACSRVCPQAVYPARHIQALRNALDGSGR